MSYRNHHHHHKTHTTTKISAPTKIKKNGEKGAPSSAVSEATRIQLTELIDSIRENDELDSVQLPANLTSTERKFVHELSKKLGLNSKSYGKGEERRITVSKVKKMRNNKKEENDGSVETNGDEDIIENSPFLELGQIGLSRLCDHMKKYPATDPNEKNILSRNNDNDVRDTIMKKYGRRKTFRSNNNKQQQQNNDKPTYPEKIYKIPKRKNNNIKQILSLPILSYRQEILHKIQSNKVTILEGDTGCGKSTQIARMILEDNPYANIVITQPRRLSAISLAERVCWEFDPNMKVGGVCGYSIRLNSVYDPSTTRILFVTPGILLQKLHSLDVYTHIILDEIHERDEFTEFLMMAIRQKISKNKNGPSNTPNDLAGTKLIMMSATLPVNEDEISLKDYWNGVCRENGGVGEISVPGRMFPVQEMYLEDILSMLNWKECHDMNAQAELNQLDRLISDLVVTNSSNKNNNNINQVLQVTDDDVNNNNADNGLVCVMCGMKAFQNTEELAVHVAMCDGGGMDSNFLALERRVQDTDMIINNSSHINYYDESEALEYEEDDDEEEMIKWDGFSGEFYNPNNSNNNGETENHARFTKEQLLSDYQCTHKDDEIDEKLILSIIVQICDTSHDGGILIFLPGWDTIQSFDQYLKNYKKINFQNQDLFRIYTLHSGIDPSDQKQVFQKLPRKGMRKIILSTNIAETSVTIDDVAFVIDSGFVKEKDYDPHLKAQTLHQVWISQASANQRKGRAGRCRPGVCFRLYSRRRFQAFRKNPTCSLQRTPLEQIVLRIKNLGLGSVPDSSENETNNSNNNNEPFDEVTEFLVKHAMSPLHPKSIRNAIELLISIGALYDTTAAESTSKSPNHSKYELTNLGWALSQITLQPNIGKMVLYAHMLGISKDVISMASALSYKSPFILPSENNKRDANMRMLQLSNYSESDLVTIMNVLYQQETCYRSGGRKLVNSFCQRNYLNRSTVQMIIDMRKSLVNELVKVGFSSYNKNNNNNGGVFRNTTSASSHMYQFEWNNSSHKLKQQYKTIFGHNNNNKASDPALTQAAIVAGLFPQIGMRNEGEINFRTLLGGTKTTQSIQHEKKAKIHRGSVNSIKGQRLGQKCSALLKQQGEEEGDSNRGKEKEFVIYGEIMKGHSHLFTINQTSRLTSPLPLILLCGERLSMREIDLPPPSSDDEQQKAPTRNKGKSKSKKISSNTNNNDNNKSHENNKRYVLSIDNGWISFQCKQETTARSLIILRQRLDIAFLKFVANPARGFKSLSQKEVDAVETLLILLRSAYHHHYLLNNFKRR